MVYTTPGKLVFFFYFAPESKKNGRSGSYKRSTAISGRIDILVQILVALSNFPSPCIICFKIKRKKFKKTLYPC